MKLIDIEENMKNSLQLVKTNKLNQAMQNLSLLEFRIVVMAIVKFRENQAFKENFIVQIYASEYAELFEVTRSTAHDNMLTAEKTLFQRQFTIKNEAGNDVKSRWISHVEYVTNENSIKLALSPVVVEHISRINGDVTPYTSYFLEKIARLKSQYSCRLYELLKQWLETSITPIFYLEIFRQQLGVNPNEYDRINNFKAKVLDFSLAEINSETDIHASYEQIKKGRIIIGFRFTVHKKREEKDVTPKSKLTLTDLTANELAIVMSQVEKFIADKAKNGIKIDEKYRQNIINKAKKERWGLDKLIKQADEYNAQNKKVKEKIAEDRRKQQAEKLAKKQEQQEFEQFIAEFEALPDDEREEILDELESLIANISFLIKPFKQNRSNAHKDQMFQRKLKEIMQKKAVA